MKPVFLFFLPAFVLLYASLLFAETPPRKTIRAADVLAEWEELGRDPKWAKTSPWSPDTIEVIKVLPTETQGRFFRFLARAYAKKGDIDKAVDVLRQSGITEHDLNTVPQMACDLARKGFVENAMKLLDKGYEDRSGKAKRQDEVRNAAIRYHLDRDEIAEALHWARQIDSKDRFQEQKKIAYYEIIRFLISKE